MSQIYKKLMEAVNDPYWDDEEQPKYTLVGVDGNVFAVIGYVVNCMKKEKMPPESIETFKNNCLKTGKNYYEIIAYADETIQALNNL
jgi:hypothetical protein